MTTHKCPECGSTEVSFERQYLSDRWSSHYLCRPKKVARCMSCGKIGKPAEFGAAK